MFRRFYKWLKSKAKSITVWFYREKPEAEIKKRIDVILKGLEEPKKEEKIVEVAVPVVEKKIEEVAKETELIKNKPKIKNELRGGVQEYLSKINEKKGFLLMR